MKYLIVPLLSSDISIVHFSVKTFCLPVVPPKQKVCLYGYYMSIPYDLVTFYLANDALYKVKRTRKCRYLAGN